MEKKKELKTYMGFFRSGLQFSDRLTTELVFPSVQRGLAVVPSAGTVSGCKIKSWKSCAF